MMGPFIGRPAQGDGTIDTEYTWGRPVTTYLSTLDRLRLLLLKARLDRYAGDMSRPVPEG